MSEQKKKGPQLNVEITDDIDRRLARYESTLRGRPEFDKGGRGRKGLRKLIVKALVEDFLRTEVEDDERDARLKSYLGIETETFDRLETAKKKASGRATRQA